MKNEESKQRLSEYPIEKEMWLKKPKERGNPNTERRLGGQREVTLIRENKRDKLR